MVHKITIQRFNGSEVRIGPLTEPLPKVDQLIKPRWGDSTIRAKVVVIHTLSRNLRWVIADEIVQKEAPPKRGLWYVRKHSLTPPSAFDVGFYHLVLHVDDELTQFTVLCDQPI